ncbi:MULTISPECIES: membrane protein insertion efficiency factor YidD [Enterobacter cloacae complex]|uniref:membrane protein insertion efficiency factor YidD n=1 Tax=Enterobacter TaxID=547 RepID=UPI000902032E|nr:membrane protein insertion efficiency factor YidD [Enterobacter kobei]MBO4157278.1 membrane protein insertion efficiency factor YidD [Enterobacter kobei]MBW7592110.1 membrane protein insertion efficiency factor YidD [Enterobacter kobei]MBW7702610.1 membrane protein insertion efficiency factor YidD [Enterobacter kobei]MBW7715636.1 membrane protein insertion efficiency factor YidD [Enterobacter kobei]
MLRSLSFWLILLYRKHAPDNVRRRCRYHPSCSKYTFVSIKRFGFCRGWKIAFKRFQRCRPPNGGIDYPPHRCH